MPANTVLLSVSLSNNVEFAWARDCPGVTSKAEQCNVVASVYSRQRVLVLLYRDGWQLGRTQLSSSLFSSVHRFSLFSFVFVYALSSMYSVIKHKVSHADDGIVNTGLVLIIADASVNWSDVCRCFPIQLALAVAARGGGVVRCWNLFPVHAKLLVVVCVRLRDETTRRTGLNRSSHYSHTAQW